MEILSKEILSLEELRRKEKEAKKQEAFQQFKEIINVSLEEEEREILKELILKILEGYKKTFTSKREIIEEIKKVEFALQLDIPAELKEKLEEKLSELKEKLRVASDKKRSSILNWYMTVLSKIAELI